jgi:DNA-binding CsgD family transcriptional regulator
VLLPNIWSHTQVFWQTPWRRSLFDALAARFRFVQFDSRGQGLSTRDLPDDHTGEAYLRDIEAVVDRLRLDRFVLLARNQFSQVAVRYALQHPDRLDALVLGNPTTDLYKGFEHLMRDRWELYTETIARLSNLPTEPAELAASFRKAVSQADHIKLVGALRELDTQSDAGQIATPTLVIVSSTSPISSQESAVRIAAVVPQAQVVSLTDPIGSSGFFSPQGEVPPAVMAIEAFVRDVQETDSAPVGATAELSSREVEVLRLIAAGKSNAQIADELVISINTVRRHVSNLLDKTGVANRAEAASYAHRHGVV